MAKLDHTMCVTVSPKCPKCGGNAQVHPVGWSNYLFKNLKDSETQKWAGCSSGISPSSSATKPWGVLVAVAGDSR
jgi:hypothetical protein